MMRAVIALVLLTGCASWIRSSVPDDARELTENERAIVTDHAERWEQIVGPLGECREYADRIRVIDADERVLLRWCWRNPPSAYVPEPEAPSRYGRAAGCVAQRGGVGLVIAYRELSAAEHASLVGHETTHLLGHCARPEGRDWIGHTDPLLWGPSGVHPL